MSHPELELHSEKPLANSNGQTPDVCSLQSRRRLLAVWILISLAQSLAVSFGWTAAQLLLFFDDDSFIRRIFGWSPLLEVILLPPLFGALFFNLWPRVCGRFFRSSHLKHQNEAKELFTATAVVAPFALAMAFAVALGLAGKNELVLYAVQICVILAAVVSVTSVSVYRLLIHMAKDSIEPPCQVASEANTLLARCPECGSENVGRDSLSRGLFQRFRWAVIIAVALVLAILQISMATRTSKDWSIYTDGTTQIYFGPWARATVREESQTPRKEGRVASVIPSNVLTLKTFDVVQSPKGHQFVLGGDRTRNSRFGWPNVWLWQTRWAQISTDGYNQDFVRLPPPPPMVSFKGTDMVIDRGSHSPVFQLHNVRIVTANVVFSVGLTVFIAWIAGAVIRVVAKSVALSRIVNGECLVCGYQLECHAPDEHNEFGE